MHSNWRISSPGNDVYICNYSYEPMWVPVVVEEDTGPVSYIVQMGEGQYETSY